MYDRKSLNMLRAPGQSNFVAAWKRVAGNVVKVLMAIFKPL